MTRIHVRRWATRPVMLCGAGAQAVAWVMPSSPQLARWPAERYCRSCLRSLELDHPRLLRAIAAPLPAGVAS